MKQFVLSTLCIFCAQIAGINLLSAQSFQRTITYHQITAFTETHVVGQDWQHVISDNGNKVAWYKQSNPKMVIVMNPDGSGYDEIVNVGTERMVEVDISADGTKVIYLGGGGNHRLNFINADGSGETALIELSNLRMKSIKINADGTKAYFVVSYNTSIVGGGGSIERGVYSINFDGTGLTQLVSPAAVAAALGVSASDISSFSGGSAGAVLEVSHDASEIVFVAKNDVSGNRHVFTMNGGSPTDISGGVDWVNAVGINYTGTKIAYCILDAGERKGYVANYDGTGVLEIANNDEYTFSDGNSLGDQITITEDGSKVLFDQFSHLYNTDGSGVIQLSANTVGSAGNPMIVGYCLRSSMTKSGSRMLFSFRDPIYGLHQLAIMDINPTNMGGSPSLSEVTMTPNAISLSPPTNAMISARITTANPSDSVWYVGNVFLMDGVLDGDIEKEVFFDDGTSAGDAVAGDDIHTHNGVGAFSSAEVGPRLLRINAEVFDSNGMLHGTAVDVPDPLYIVPDTTSIGIEKYAENELTFHLQSVTPNPTTNGAHINYSMKESGQVRLTVMNMTGKTEAVLIDQQQAGGNHRIFWDGTNQNGVALAGGVYFIGLEVDSAIQLQKLVLLR